MAFDGDLNRYQLGRCLGHGGYGAAYLAEHDSGLQCVVKLFHGVSAARPEELTRLRISLARMRNVRSEQVVPVLDSGIDSDAVGGPQPWVAMAFMQGTRSLDQVLSPDRAVNLQWAHRVIQQIALGLQALHRVGLMHRDLKPSNVLVDGAGRAWLIDFDLVKLAGVTSRTPVNDRLGTLLWMAPEQTVGVVRPPTDLWALGLVAHELLTGRHPLARYAESGLTHDVLGAINSAALVDPEVPAPYGELIGALLHKLPVARPQSAAQVLQWLEAPGNHSLAPPHVECLRGLRWALARREEIDAIELARSGEIPAEAVDAVVRARDDHARLRTAARRIHLPIGYEPSACAKTAVSPSLFDGPFAGAAGPDPDVPRVLFEAAGVAREDDFVLVPFTKVDDIGVEASVGSLREALRHRDRAGGAKMIGTIECSAELLDDPSRAMGLLAACSQLEVDGWRLWVEGLQPDCGVGIMRLVRDAGEALVEAGVPVWVRASDLSRWAIVAGGRVGLAYRAGRGLWTRRSNQPRHVPERVEIDRLAGPVPREVAERLAIWRPDLVACGCRACDGRRLPPEGGRTVLHNLFVVGRQLEQCTDAAAIVERLSCALELRDEISGPVSWRAEIIHLLAVRAAVTDRVRTASSTGRFLFAR